MLTMCFLSQVLPAQQSLVVLLQHGRCALHRHLLRARLHAWFRPAQLGSTRSFFCRPLSHTVDCFHISPATLHCSMRQSSAAARVLDRESRVPGAASCVGGRADTAQRDIGSNSSHSLLRALVPRCTRRVCQFILRWFCSLCIISCAGGCSHLHRRWSCRYSLRLAPSSFLCVIQAVFAIKTLTMYSVQGLPSRRCRSRPIPCGQHR